MPSIRLPTYFLSHGGGPWPYMEGESRRRFEQLERSLIDMRAELGDAPRAVLMVSGHWEEPGFAASAAGRPGMVYDYYGFPEYLYHISYPAPGDPALARRVSALLGGGGLACRLDAARGFDHGAFSLMKPLYPHADMPLVQLSLDSSLDPALHLQAGRLLAPLRDEGVLIIGSGLSYHNLRDIRDRRAAEPSRQFDAWLQDTLLQCPAPERGARLLHWEQAPSARAAHPREDHLIPLMVAIGAAEQEAGALTHHQTTLMNHCVVSSFRFGEPPVRKP
jgi:aromatic ring-opening dioxygenase catalytic subunit (LigB family)